MTALAPARPGILAALSIALSIVSLFVLPRAALAQGGDLDLSAQASAREVEVGEAFTVQLKALTERGGDAPSDPELRVPSSHTARRRVESAPRGNRHTEALDETARHSEAAKRHRMAALAQIEGVTGGRNRKLDDIVYRWPVEVGHPARFPRSRRRVPDVVQAVGIRIRQRSNEVRVDDRDGRRGERKAQGERGDRDEGEGGRTEKPAGGEP